MTFSPETQAIIDGHTNPDSTHYTPTEQQVLMQGEQLKDDGTGVDAPTTVLGKTVDLLSRGQYASAGFASEILTSKFFTHPVSTMTAAVKEFGSELTSPQDRRYFSDVIRQVAPKFADEHKYATGILGFVGDVAFDPLTYVGAGVAKAGTKVVIKAGLPATKAFARKGIKEGAEKVLSKQGLKARAGLVQKELARKEAFSPALEKARVDLAAVARKGNANMGEAESMLWATKKLNKAAHDLDLSGGVQALNKKYGLTLGADDFGDSVFSGFVAAEGRAEKKLAKMVHSALLSGDTDLLQSGGVRFMGKTVVPEGVIKEVTDRLGFPTIKELLSSSPIGKAMRVGLNRFPKEIPKEIKALEHKLFAALASSERRVKKDLHKIFGLGTGEGVTKASRVRVGVFMSHFDDLETSTYHELEKKMRKESTKAAKAVKNDRRIMREMGVSEENLPAMPPVFSTDMIEEEVGRRVSAILDSPAKQKQLLARYASAGDDPLAFNVTKGLSKKEAALFADSPLSAAENSLMVTLKQEMKMMGQEEIRARLLRDMKQWYSPRYYSAIKDSHSVTSNFAKMKAGMSAFFSPDESRNFRTLAEAKKFGYDPIFDAGQLYAMRATVHAEQLAKTDFNIGLQLAVPDLALKLKQLGGLDTKDLSTALWDGSNEAVAMTAAALKKSRSAENKDLAVILEHVRFVGSSLYDTLDTKTKNDMLRVYDRTLNLFRASATVMRAAFGSRNAVSNQFQMYLGGGMQGIKHLNIAMDPRAAFDSVALMRGIRRPALLSKMRNLTGAYGSKYSPTQLVSMLKEHNIIRNVAYQGVETHAPLATERGTRRMFKLLDRKRAVKKAAFNGSDAAPADGMAALISGSVNYWDVPAYLEDHARTTMFVNMLKQGHSGKAAAEFVEKALFDYTHGMSQFETRVMRRLIPFYSFQRFAVPLIAKATANHPGRVVNSVKAGKALMSAYGAIHKGESLTPAERAAIPDWLLSQPHEHLGFEKEMATFATFNNYSPLDVMGFIETDPNTGAMDIGESVKNGALAQLTPLIKVPMEFALGTDFFTGRDFEDARNVGDLDVSRLMGNLAQLVVNQSAERLGSPVGAAVLAPAAQQVMRSFADATPEGAEFILKGLLGYEEGINRDGNPTAYFSPYRYHMLTSLFPALNTAVQEARVDQNPLQRTMRSLFGIPTVKRDLKKDAATKMYLRKKRKDDLRRDYNMAVRTKQEGKANRSLTALRTHLTHWEAEAAALQEGLPDRGGPQ